MIPNNLRTGFDATETPQELSAEQQALQIRLVSLVVLMVEHSLTNAMTYAVHKDIKEVDDDVMRLALKVEAMRFFDRADLETDLDEIVKSLTADGFESDPNDDPDDPDDPDGSDESDATGVHDYDAASDAESEFDEVMDEVMDEIEIPADALPEKRLDADGVCQCETCSKFHTIEEDWGAWNVEDDYIKSFLKSHIENLDAMFES
jgi:hypothetical protein